MRIKIALKKKCLTISSFAIFGVKKLELKISLYGPFFVQFILGGILMDKASGKLTVYFEEPFWVGVFERIEDGKLSVA